MFCSLSYERKPTHLELETKNLRYTVNEKGGSRRVETSHRWKFTTLRLLTRMWVEIYNHKVVLHVKLVTFTTSKVVHYQHGGILQLLWW